MPTSGRYYGDRFIPARSSMNFDVANYLLVGSRRGGDNMQQQPTSLSTEDYRNRLSEALMINTRRVLSFWWSEPTTGNFEQELNEGQGKRRKRRYISKSAKKTLDAPEILDDYHLNLIDWSSGNNVLAIALRDRVCLWDASNGSDSELFSVDEETGPVTSVSWAPNGQHIAVGMNNSIVELWDMTSNQKLRTLQGGHRARVGSLSWNEHILTTGGKDSMIIDNDVRIRSHHVRTYMGHKEEVCQLKWSNSGKQLASGGNDSLLYIWDRSMASSSSQTRCLHKFEDHVSTVKAIAWCPHESNLLASSGGAGDQFIRFRNTQTGVCLNSINTGSQVCSLLWSKREKELLSSHGPTQNQLTLWKYPSTVKIVELLGHTSRVLFLTQSPDGCMVASAAGDETLRIWNVFETPEVAKLTTGTTCAGPFNYLNNIR